MARGPQFDFAPRGDRRRGPGPELVRCDGIRDGVRCDRPANPAWGYGVKNFGRCCAPEHLLRPRGGEK